MSQLIHLPQLTWPTLIIHVWNESTDYAGPNNWLNLHSVSDVILRIGVWCSLKKACDNPSFVQSLCRIVRRYGLINIQKWQSMFCLLVRDVLHNVFFRSVHSFVITRSLNPILFPVNFSVREETIKSRKVWFFSFLCFHVLEKCHLLYPVLWCEVWQIFSPLQEGKKKDGNFSYLSMVMRLSFSTQRNNITSNSTWDSLRLGTGQKV